MATILGTAGNDNLPGTAGDDIISGLAGHDRYNSNWSSGEDLMIGGLGSDIYFVNSTGDVVTEGQNMGNDTIVSRLATYSLDTFNTRNIENLTLDDARPHPLVAPTAVSGIGNALNNYIIGNSNNNVLNGGGGDDTIFDGNGNDLLFGGVGNDTLYGGAGNDTIGGGAGDDRLVGESGDDALFGHDGNDQLFGSDGRDKLDGGTGSDFMNGGAGNDEYVVDSLGDTITAQAGQGFDMVWSSITYQMPATLWKLALTGTANLSGTGNASDNSMFGNVGNNGLSGGAGKDFISGFIGDDTINGNGGNDELWGDAGRDRFVFSDRGAGNADKIADFNHADDTIVLSDFLDGTQNLGVNGLRFTNGVLQIGSYFEGAGFNGSGAQASGIYVDTTAGGIYYNPTSSLAGDSQLIATLNTSVASALDNTDFVSGVPVLAL